MLATAERELAASDGAEQTEFTGAYDGHARDALSAQRCQRAAASGCLITWVWGALGDARR
jgi:hypothetical protein